MIGFFFLASIHLVFLGMIGEYVGAIHTMVQKRPFAIERERINFEYGPGTPLKPGRGKKRGECLTDEYAALQSRLEVLTKHVPPGQVLTLSGDGGMEHACSGTEPLRCSPCCWRRWDGRVTSLAVVPSTVINITVAFLGYKWFVFKTKGNYLREWMPVRRRFIAAAWH